MPSIWHQSIYIKRDEGQAIAEVVDRISMGSVSNKEEKERKIGESVRNPKDVHQYWELDIVSGCGARVWSPGVKP